jgi:hypothetical protein
MMKQWSVLLWMGLIGTVYATNNPFELKPGIQHLEKDVNDLISDLKSLKSDDELDDELGDELDADEETVSQEDATRDVKVQSNEVLQEQHTADTMNDNIKTEQSAETKENEKKVTSITGAKSTEEQRTVKVEPSVQEEKPKALPIAEKTLKDEKEKRTIASEAQHATLKEEEVVEVEKLTPTPAKMKYATNKQAQTEASAKPHVAKKPAEVLKKEEKAISTIEEVRKMAFARKPAAKQPQKLTIESIMNSNGADVDIEKERQEEALRAEEELRKAIAAVDRED